MKFGIAFDNSELSNKAAELCLKLASEGDEVHVMTVIDPPRTDPPFGYSIEAAQSILDQRKAKAKEELAELERRLEAANISVWKVYVEIGDARTTLVEFAKKVELDVLYLGSRGLSGIAGFFMGSASSYAPHHCPCAVTVIVLNIEELMCEFNDRWYHGHSKGRSVEKCSKCPIIHPHKHVKE